MENRSSEGLASILGAFVLVAVVAYSCAVNPVTGRSELSIVPVSEKEEIALGAQAYGPAVQQQGGFYRDKELEAYVQEVGMKLARVSHRPDLQYRYRVLNSSVPNAFALPGGFIVVNRGLVVGLKSEAELAAVLGHETGHVTARHSVAGYQRAIAANVLLAGVSVAAGSRAGVMELSGITASLLENGFSRDQEREADWLGIDYMVKARYSPEGAIRLHEYFYEQLEGKKDPSFAEGLFRTHPFSRERMDNARRRIAERYPDTVKNPNYTFNESAFMKKTARLREVQKAYRIADEGDKHLKEKRFGEALAKYQAALAMEPDQAQFHSAVGKVRFQQKEFAAAEESFRKAIRIDEEFFEPHLYSGAVRYEEKRYREAIPSLSRSMDLLPTKPGAAMLSKSYEAIGDRENAKKYAEMAK